MSNNTFLSTRLMAGAALVGLVGAAGVFIYEQIYAEKRRAMLVREVARLDKQVSTMRSELEALRELQKETQLRRMKQKRSPRPKEVKSPKAAPLGDTVDAPEQSYASDSEYFTDYQSVIATDGEMDSEEFYDVPTDDEDDTLRESLRNGNAAKFTLDDDKSDKLDLPVQQNVKENST
ncbi:uncharacterized protein LOC106721282 [Papilio machaon]|uniref:uncharacterized protein LOC106721282 n=1 Tax=Papilio machaon TaxID=76193 RepID=UPI001E663C06|nr:uncharacterized protein LOC106721282 [Papilio machaon]